MFGASDGNIKPLHILDKTNAGVSSSNSAEDNKITFLALKRIDSRNANIRQCSLYCLDLSSVPVLEYKHK